MTAIAGRTVGIVGALGAFPRRMAARAVEARGGQMRRGVTRRTGIVVFGRKLLETCSDAVIAARIEAARAEGRVLTSESGFLRMLEGASGGAAAGMTRARLIGQSQLAAAHLDLLALFDAFEHDREPYSFRDLILARKYAGLIAGGASWGGIARSVHRFGPAASLTAKALQVGGRAIYARHEEGLSELDGQLLLGFGASADDDAEALFARAEEAEAAGRHDEAAALFRRCLAIDPGDSVAAFNCANCLAAAGRPREAEHELVRALSLDPGFVEAWFNLAGLVAARGRGEAARHHLEQAIALDAGYADAVFNLAALAFEAGDLDAARAWWERYLGLDGESEWARRAARGIAYVAMQAAPEPVG